MKIVVFGLAVSSSWGNGHATLWRGLLRALGRLGHECVFFERDEPWYASHRDLREMEGVRVVLYPGWPEVSRLARDELADADAGIVTSFCADAFAASGAVLDSGALPVFYDLDTPVTLERLEAGESVPWVGPRGYADYALVLSFTGGRSLDALRRRLGATRVAPLYGSVDPDVHRPSRPSPEYESALTYLATYAADRQAGVDALFLEPARRLPDRRFLLAGPQYPPGIAWQPNVFWRPHLPPSEHGAFFASAPLTLNVTRAPMAAFGWCPSGRLFEAAASGVPVLSDRFEGLDAFFTPGEEILVARDTEEAVELIRLPRAALRRIGARARQRALDAHAAGKRAEQLLALLNRAKSGDPALRFHYERSEPRAAGSGLHAPAEIRPDRET